MNNNYKKIILIFVILCSLIIAGTIGYMHLKKDDPIVEKTELPKEPEVINITISAIGDCTIGSDSKVGNGWNNFNSYLKDNDYGYYFREVYNVLNNDDLTIANLEGTFTDATEKAVKNYNFKNTNDYVKVLTEGSVEIVNIANNHIRDYKEEGYIDTINTLNNANLPYFGYTSYSVQNIKGIKIGFAGFNYYDERYYDKYKQEIDAATEYLKSEEVDLIILSFHWGIQGTYNQTEKQTEVGHYAIDSGANLVLGHHPHRIQGIEKYNDKNIVYSLGNFVFGGNRNPEDKDSFIYQETFTFEDKKLTEQKVNIVPVRISGEENLNNYQPIIAEGNKKERIINKINNSSVNFRWEDESINN